MRRVATLCAAMSLLFVKYCSVNSQIVSTYEKNYTSGKCQYNGTQYAHGVYHLRDPCQLIDCDNGTGALTVVECSYSTPPPTCTLMPPKNGSYPECCPDDVVC
uniref:Putative secreted protein n=1 Tax=Amblyomma cajennense TaxID=34607 RepID=A0A023FPP7_AMBCJ